jgi:uncharacterized protein DUF6265
MTLTAFLARATAALCAIASCALCAQPAPPAAEAPSLPKGDESPTVSIMPATPAEALAALAWLQGCWHGNVNQREFREHWLPPAGGMMVGAGHTVMGGKTQDYEFVRLEVRPEGLFYVVVPMSQKEQTFKLVDARRDEVSSAQIFTFDNVANEFPQHIMYRRGGEGWLYAGIEGTLSGQDRKVIYPMRHLNCETSEPIRQ